MCSLRDSVVLDILARRASPFVAHALRERTDVGVHELLQSVRKGEGVAKRMSKHDFGG